MGCSMVQLLAFVRGMAPAGFFWRPKRAYCVWASHRRSLQLLASRSLPLDPQTAPVRISRTVGTIRTPCPEGIVDGVLGEWRAVAVYLVCLVCLVYL